MRHNLSHREHTASEASGFPGLAAVWRVRPFSSTFFKEWFALRANPTQKKVVGKPYSRHWRSSKWQREAGSRGASHEESPPTCRTGDRAQARGGRPSALEQQRHVVAGPMRCANPERGWSCPTRRCGTRPKRGRVNPPRQSRPGDSGARSCGPHPCSTRGPQTPHAFRGPQTPHASGDGPMERRNLTGARPRRQVVRRRAQALDVAAQPNAGPNRRGLLPAAIRAFERRVRWLQARAGHRPEYDRSRPYRRSS